MSNVLRVFRFSNGDSANGYDDYACIAFPYRPTDSLPYIPRRPFKADDTPLRTERIASHV